jgi:hypothetical protein
MYAGTTTLRQGYNILQTIFNMAGTQNTDIAMLKHEMQGARADITSVKATQSDHGELLREHSKRFDKLEAIQSDHGELLRGHSKRFDKLEAIQSEQGQKLDLILQLLQKKG